MKIGFIGCGAMGGAIVNGLLNKNYVNPSQIYITTDDYKYTQELAEKLQVNPCETNTKLAETCDVVILAVKPFAITAIVSEIKETLQTAKPVVVSIAAGTSIEKIYSAADGYPLVRVMPNIGAQIGVSTTAIYGSELVTPEQLNTVKEIFERVGTVVVLTDEKQFSPFVGISGSSPAFTFMFIEAMAKAANKYGIDKKTAVKIATDAVKGAATLAEHETQKGTSMGALIDELCTAGGTTISGIVAAEEHGLSNAVIKAVSATTEKDQTLNN